MPHYYLIVNPISGYKKGRDILDKIKAVFQQAEVQITIDVTTHKNHPYELANTKTMDTFDAICIVGGDGTFHEVINGMLKRTDRKKLPIGFVPGGTGNSLMHDLNCLNPVQAVQNILSKRMGKMDIMELDSNGQLIYSFNIVGWGMPAAVNIRAEKMRWAGGHRYNVASLIEVFKNKTKEVKFVIDGKGIQGLYGFFLACNTMYTGNGMKMVPDAKFNDGYIDVLLARKVGRLKLLALFVKVFTGRHIGDSAIEYFRAKTFSIQANANEPLNIDGQNLGETPVSVKILKEHLDFFI